VIPRRYIQQWRNTVPWTMDSQVEQDLVISRAIIAMFNNPVLQDQVAFRGGTALGKLYFNPQNRYSEDIDIVQVGPGPIKPIIDGIRDSLSFLGSPSVRQKIHNNTLRFTFDSEIPPVSRMKLKVEINTREHFTVMGYVYKSFQVNNDWFSGKARLKTYELEEMAGTKMRALYQRKKGRDLFDLYIM
jgi:predicted nucleotidyltransferase component of viral defense system